MNVNNNIMKYELKTSEYFGGRVPNRIYINSELELDKFYNIFSDKVNLKKDYLKNNSAFVQIETVGSGSIRKKLTSVTFDDDNVNFQIDTKKPQIGTCDMATWYLVALIPKQEVEKLKLSGWKKPSEIQLPKRN